MTYKGVYRDGIVILQGDTNIQNGALVDVNLRGAKRTAKSSARSKTIEHSTLILAATSTHNAWNSLLRTKLTKAQRMAALLAARGSWKDRPDFKGKSSAQAAAELRTKASRRGRNG
jgi:hypothetical protein